MKKTLYFSIAIALIIAFGLCGCFFSVPKEFELGSIAGIAQDQFMKGIPGVQVTIIGTENVAYTDDTGTFFFGELQPGSYTLSFFLQGYPTQQKSVTVQKGQSRTLMVEMVPSGGTASSGLMGGPNTTNISNLQNNTNLQNTTANPLNAGVYMLYVANAGPMPQNNPYSAQNMAEGNPYGTGADPSINPPSTAGGGIQSEIAMLYGHDPVAQSYSGANTALGPNASAEELLTFSQYQDKKKNNLMVVNSVSRAAVSIIEWTPNVRPFWLDMSDNGMLYIADSANNITIMNTSGGNASVSSTIPLGGYIVCDIAVGASGSRLFCALASAGDPAVGVIDTTTNSFMKAIPLPRLKDQSIGQPWGICAHKTGQRAYVTLGTDIAGEVVFINTLNNSVIGTVKVGQNPFGIDVTPDGRKLFVANQNSATVTVIDTTTSQVIGTVGVGLSPTRVAITPDGSKAVVSNKGSNSVSILDTMTGSVITTLPVGTEPIGVSVTKDGKMAYVANSKSDDISMIDLTLNSVVNKTIPFPGGMPFDVIAK